MKKKTVTADEIVYLITERLRENGRIATHHSPFAVVPDKRHNWTIITPARSRRKEPDFIERLERIQEYLRAQYSLAK
ncbi:MAG: hypothetical protein EON84_18380 [Bradyrhizobiaceae bacterium]|nr:MAG: hypothetical protein EON84_18380 [Bradyrhizobiaceae bacterium]